MDRTLHRRIPRKPPHSLETRYPEPDPNDPFAPLWVLRTRSSNPAIDLRGLYDPNPLPPRPSLNPRRRSQSTPVETVLFPPPAPSLLTDSTSESGSSTDADTIVPGPGPISSKRALHIPRFFLTRVTKKSVSSSPLPEFAPLRRVVTCDTPAPSSQKPPLPTLKKPAPSVVSSPHPIPTPEPTPTRRPRPHSSHGISTPPIFALAPRPAVHPPPDPEWHPPTPAQLAHAASLSVTAESGLRVPFAALFAAQRTVVVFVRHFWCPLCQDYMSTLVSAAQPHRMFAPAEDKDAISTQPIHLVVISNGAHAFIPKYRQLFGLPFDMYTDPDLRVYSALGMGRDGGASRTPSHIHTAPLLDGGYVRHGLVGGIAMVVIRALRTGMPVWEKGGDIDQLGGEFVLGPGLQCSYAHRMQTPKGHAPIADVLKAAGVAVPAPAPGRAPAARTLPPIRRRNSSTTATETNPGMKEFGAGWGGARTSRTAAGKLEAQTQPHVHTHARATVSVSVSAPTRARDSVASLPPMTHEEEARWMEGRAEALERLRARKSARRGAFVGCLAVGEEGGVGVEGRDRDGDGEYVGVGAGRGLCSPVWEEDGDGEVLVIGFANERASAEVVVCDS